MGIQAIQKLLCDVFGCKLILKVNQLSWILFLSFISMLCIFFSSAKLVTCIFHIKNRIVDRRVEQQFHSPVPSVFIFAHYPDLSSRGRKSPRVWSGETRKRRCYFRVNARVRFTGPSDSRCTSGLFNAAHQHKSFATTMIEQLGLIGTIRDEEQSPEEPDTESEQEVGPRFGSVRRRSRKWVLVFIHTVSEFKTTDM